MKNFVPILKYLLVTIKHKWFVLVAGLKTKTPILQLLLHDWSKFTLSELPHYARQFYGTADDPDGWLRCWIHHQNYNPHHWEYWFTRSAVSGFNKNAPAPMPEKYVREMVADWLGASRAYSGAWPESLQKWEWYQKNFFAIYSNVHADTRKKLLDILSEIFPFELIIENEKV